MCDLRRKTADRGEPLGLDQALFHRPEIGAVLKDVHVPDMLAVLDAVDGHVHDLSLALAGANDDGFVEMADTGTGLTDQFVVSFPHRAKITHLPSP